MLDEPAAFRIARPELAAVIAAPERSMLPMALAEVHDSFQPHPEGEVATKFGYEGSMMRSILIRLANPPEARRMTEPLATLAQQAHNRSRRVSFGGHFPRSIGIQILSLSLGWLFLAAACPVFFKLPETRP
jgi:hypothetical protein